jgi:hypothetical protein
MASIQLCYKYFDDNKLYLVALMYSNVFTSSMIVARTIRAHILKGPKRIKGIWNSKQEALKR